MKSLSDRSELKRRQKERQKAEQKAKKAAEAPKVVAKEKEVSAADAEAELDATVSTEGNAERR